MKTNLLSLIFFTIFSFSNAQEYALGVKGGFNYYNIGDIFSIGGSFIGGVNETFSPNNELGTQLGVFLDVSFDKLYIRPELNFVTNKNSYDFPFKISKWKATKIDIPILVGYKIFDPISIYIGPSFSFFNDMTIEGANNQPDAAPINYYKSTTGFNFGIELEFKRFGVDLRYELGLKETEGEVRPQNQQDFYQSIYGINQADVYSYTPSQISLSLNIFLFRTNGDNISDVFSGLFKSNNCWCPKN